MKRREIMRKLREAGFSVREGGNHSLVFDRAGRFRAVLGRHKEIPERNVRNIERQTGLNLH